MASRLTKYEVTPGKYWYSRPGWNSKQLVEVYQETVEGKSQLVMRFKPGYYPCTVKGCPEDAIFEVKK